MAWTMTTLKASVPWPPWEAPTSPASTCSMPGKGTAATPACSRCAHVGRATPSSPGRAGRARLARACPLGPVTTLMRGRDDGQHSSGCRSGAWLRVVDFRRRWRFLGLCFRRAYSIGHRNGPAGTPGHTGGSGPMRRTAWRA